MLNKREETGYLGERARGLFFWTLSFGITTINFPLDFENSKYDQ